MNKPAKEGLLSVSFCSVPSEAFVTNGWCVRETQNGLKCRDRSVVSRDFTLRGQAVKENFLFLVSTSFPQVNNRHVLHFFLRSHFFYLMKKVDSSFLKMCSLRLPLESSGGSGKHLSRGTFLSRMGSLGSCGLTSDLDPEIPM